METKSKLHNKKIRDDYCPYFNGEGAALWKWKLIK